MLRIGSKGIVQRDLQTPGGMLYKGTKVSVREHKDKYTHVSDGAGRMFWIKSTEITV